MCTRVILKISMQKILKILMQKTHQLKTHTSTQKYYVDYMSIYWSLSEIVS